jgi:hypothetical protein
MGDVCLFALPSKPSGFVAARDHQKRRTSHSFNAESLNAEAAMAYVKVTILSESEHVPEERIQSVHIWDSCSMRSPDKHCKSPKVSSTLHSLRVLKAAIRGDIGNKLPAQAFAVEHVRSTGGSARAEPDEEWNRDFVEGSRVLFGSSMEMLSRLIMDANAAVRDAVWNDIHRRRFGAQVWNDIQRRAVCGG